jgi:hypothetical protein
LPSSKKMKTTLFYCLVFLLLVVCLFILLIRHQEKILIQEPFVPFINRRIRPYSRIFRIYRDNNLDYVRNRIDKLGLGTLW